MKWFLITWYISGGFDWTSYEFDDYDSCIAAQKLMVDKKVFADRYHWYCIRKHGDTNAH